MMLRNLLFVVSIAMLCPRAPAGAAVTFGQAALGNVFTEGEAVVIPIQADGSRVHWRVVDFFGTEVATGDENLAGGRAELRPRVTAPGYFSLEVETSGRTSEPARTVFAVVPTPPQDLRQSPFGVMSHFAKGWATDIVPLIAKAGIAHDRDEQPWRQVEKEQGDYRFSPRLGGYMEQLAQFHIDPLIVLAFANPLYDGGKTPFSDEGRTAYAAYAAAVVRNYQPTLHEVEIWNEYNGSFCEGPCRSDRAGYYASMLRDAYRSIKAVAPDTTVLGGAAVPIPMDYYRALFDKGALQSMDAIVIHPYRKNPEGADQDVEALRALMARYGNPKPIWATEFSDLADMHKSRDDVARYLVRMSTLLLAAKVERIYWYLLRDYQEFTGLGLLRDEGDPLGRYTPTPAYPAYANLIHQLDGASFIRREASDSNVDVYAFAARHGEVRVAWSAGNTQYTLASTEPVHVVDLMGGDRTVAPRNGMVSIPLDTNPVYIVGGLSAATGQPGGGRTVIADSGTDFSLEQGRQGWSYGMITRPDGKLTLGSSFPKNFMPLQPSPSGDSWITPVSPTLKIKARIMHPGRVAGAAAWAVRRWSAVAAGPVRISGAVDLADPKNAGVSFAIVVDGRVAYAAALHGDGSSAKTTFDLPLTVAAGETIDFCLGPDAAGGIDFDATRFSASIRPGA